MVFFFNGRKPSKGYDVASGCMLIIAFAAIIYFFTLIESLEDLEGYYLQIIFILLMAGSIVIGLFQKKGKLHTNKIEIKNNYLLLNTIKIPLEELQLDIYEKNGFFYKYHLWDKRGNFTIFSNIEDDLCKEFATEYTFKTFYYTETSTLIKGLNITIRTVIGELNYNLESGGYEILKNGKSIRNTPDFYINDPKYKLGKPLLKKKKK